MATTKPAFICSSCARALRISARRTTTTRTVTSVARHNTGDDYQNERLTVPRWQRTPDAMKMPFRIRPPSGQPEWKVNHDPEVLDKALDEFIGDAAGVHGRELLDEETKWLAVTHKSFENGARGFNDRLAFLGRRIVELQVDKALLRQIPSPMPAITEVIEGTLDVGPKEKHPILNSVINITDATKATMLNPARVRRIAESHGLDKAVRWQPRQVERLNYSGRDGTIAMAVFAIVGAVALQKGGAVANKVAKERILKPLGIVVS